MNHVLYSGDARTLIPGLQRVRVHFIGLTHSPSGEFNLGTSSYHSIAISDLVAGFREIVDKNEVLSADTTRHHACLRIPRTLR